MDWGHGIGVVFLTLKSGGGSFAHYFVTAPAGALTVVDADDSNESAGRVVQLGGFLAVDLRRTHLVAEVVVAALEPAKSGMGNDKGGNKANETCLR